MAGYNLVIDRRSVVLACLTLPYFSLEAPASVTVNSFYLVARLKNVGKAPVFYLDVEYEFAGKTTVILDNAPVPAKGHLKYLTSSKRLVFKELNGHVVYDQELTPGVSPVGAANDPPQPKDFPSVGKRFTCLKRPRVDQIYEAIQAMLPDGARKFQEDGLDIYESLYEDIPEKRMTSHRIGQTAMRLLLPFPVDTSKIQIELRMAVREQGDLSDPSVWEPGQGKTLAYAAEVRDKVGQHLVTASAGG